MNQVNQETLQQAAESACMATVSYLRKQPYTLPPPQYYAIYIEWDDLSLQSQLEPALQQFLKTLRNTNMWPNDLGVFRYPSHSVIVHPDDKLISTIYYALQRTVSAFNENLLLSLNDKYWLQGFLLNADMGIKLYSAPIGGESLQLQMETPSLAGVTRRSGDISLRAQANNILPRLQSDWFDRASRDVIMRVSRYLHENYQFKTITDAQKLVRKVFAATETFKETQYTKGLENLADLLFKRQRILTANIAPVTNGSRFKFLESLRELLKPENNNYADADACCQRIAESLDDAGKKSCRPRSFDLLAGEGVDAENVMARYTDFDVEDIYDLKVSHPATPISVRRLFRMAPSAPVENTLLMSLVVIGIELLHYKNQCILEQHFANYSLDMTPSDNADPIHTAESLQEFLLTLVNGHVDGTLPEIEGKVVMDSDDDYDDAGEELPGSAQDDDADSIEAAAQNTDTPKIMMHQDPDPAGNDDSMPAIYPESKIA